MSMRKEPTMLHTSPKLSLRDALRAVFALGVSLLVFFPVYMAVVTALKTPQEIQSFTFSLLPSRPQWSNFVMAMRAGNWPRYFFNSVYVTVWSVVLSVITNSLAGFAFARLNFKGRDMIFGLSLIGLMVPPIVNMIPLFLIMKHWPLAGGNNLLGLGGSGLINTHASLIMFFMSNSFGVFLFRQFFLTFPKSLDDAARIDGAGSLLIFRKIYLPMSTAILGTVVALRTTKVWNEYSWPLIITNTDDMRTVQLALSLFRQEHGIQWHYLMAATVLITLPLVVLFVIMQRHFVEGIVTTGEKG